MRTFLSVAAFFVAACGSVVVAEPVDFNRDVRPILSDACFACHGPDAGQRKAELRLDQREGLFRSRDGVTVVDPKSAEHSELLQRILSDDPDVMMPPASGGRRLTAAEKDTIRQWIVEGAEFRGHWAYIPPQRPEPPAIDVAPDGNAIDRFVQQQLDARKLSPLPTADPVTLARRLSFDLTGLPPTPETVAEFAADPSPQKWAAMVDRLLSSQHYAERMTALWLDQVRYADTNGIHGDNHRDVWMYRDYVIDAFHRNMPFDQFTIEQLAGDLLPDATDEQKIASGYNRLLMTTREGGAQPKEYLAKYSADRVRNASTVWLGATMGCCECHDHKFDPYSIRDFYRFAAFFADIQDVAVGVQPQVKMPSRDQKERQAALQKQLEDIQHTLTTQTPELDAAMNQWAAELKVKLAETPRQWTAAAVVDMKSTAGQQLTLQPDGSLLTSGPQPRHDTYIVVLQPPSGSITGIRLETLRDDSFALKSLSRAPGNGNFVMSGIQITHIRNADSEEQSLQIENAIASFEQDKWPVKNVLDGKDETGWAVSGHELPLKAPTAVFRLKTPVTLSDGDRLVIHVQQNAVDRHNIGRFRLSTTAAETPSLDDNGLGLAPQYAAIIEAWPNATDQQKTDLATHYRSVAPALDAARKQLAEVTMQQKALDAAIPETLITRTQAPREIRVLARGDWMDDSGDVVSPAVPDFLQEVVNLRSTEQRASRLDLAQWLVDKQNPLVARVFVNRLWKVFLGKGIVRSADDFGSQGTWPTHPELLDWLAVEFRDSGWNVQHVIRQIVLSSTYRRSSATPQELVDADPFNQWLARQSRFRLDAEFIRDTSLAVSGLLVDRVGGRSVKPYQPAGYWAHLNFPKREWQADTGEDQYRRGLYTYWCRTFLHPSMRSFDAPSREECTVDRPRSNNSLQALVLLNDPSYVEVARALAARTLTEGGATVPARLDFLFRQCLSRTFRPEEAAVLSRLLLSQQQQFASADGSAVEFLKVGQSAVPSGLDTSELAAWTSVARVILNLHEAITRS
ncbi:MAG: PSD1 and planctomycete cytochrome C domain-containing protein [Planctomycetaceae bacterium]